MKTLALSTIALLVCLTSPTLAQDSSAGAFTEFNFVAGFEPMHVSQGAFDIFSGDDWVTGGRVGAEVEILSDLFVQLGLVSFSNSEPLLGNYQAELQVAEPQVVVRKGFTLLDGIRPYVAVGAMYTMADAVVELTYPHKIGRESGILDGSFGARGGGGVELSVPRSVFGARRSGLMKDFTAGAAIEWGYSYRSPISLNGLKQGKRGDLDEDPPMQSGELDLGELDMSGTYIAVDFRFYF